MSLLLVIPMPITVSTPLNKMHLRLPIIRHQATKTWHTSELPMRLTLSPKTKMLLLMHHKLTQHTFQHSTVLKHWLTNLLKTVPLDLTKVNHKLTCLLLKVITPLLRMKLAVDTLMPKQHTVKPRASQILKADKLTLMLIKPSMVHHLHLTMLS